jgi:beta-glucosidase
MKFMSLRKKKRALSQALFFACLTASSALYAQNKPAYLNERLPVDARVKSLLSKLTLAEKANLLGYNAKAVPRLNIPAYNWCGPSYHIPAGNRHGSHL